MCHVCVINNVKSSMLSRRDFFRKSAAAGLAATAAGAVSARPALAQASGKVVDLTHTLDGDFPTFDGKPGILFTENVNFDASLHFSKDGTSVAELDPQNLICPLCIIDIKAKAADEPNSMVEPEDIEAYVSAHGDIPQGACVAMNSGWQDKLGDASYRNNADGNFAFPGFSKAATDMLAEMGAASIGVDTLSLDPGNSADFAVHYSWLPGGRFGIENLANLDQLPASGATMFIGAPKHRNGTGGPARVMAMI